MKRNKIIKPEILYLNYAESLLVISEFILLKTSVGDKLRQITSFSEPPIAT